MFMNFVYSIRLYIDFKTASTIAAFIVYSKCDFDTTIFQIIE